MGPPRCASVATLGAFPAPGRASIPDPRHPRGPSTVFNFMPCFLFHDDRGGFPEGRRASEKPRRFLG
eukprot:5372782-Pyramimonas_sp.AAC.1